MNHLDSPADPIVAHAFESYPEPLRAVLLDLRALVYEVARATPGVGKLDEQIKWGQPAYLTTATGSGATIRIDAVKGASDSYGIYTSCNTPLVERFAQEHGDAFRYDKNRGIIFRLDEPPDREAVGQFIADALTYHQTKATRPTRSPAPGASESRRR